MDAFGLRLREERERKKLSQADFAALAGVTRTAQGNYEAGKRAPDAQYLAALAAAGVDATYVLTGVPSPSLKAEEVELLRRYRAASPDLRAATLRMLGADAVVAGAPGAQISGGEQGQVVMGDQRVEAPLTFQVGGQKGGRKK